MKFNGETMSVYIGNTEGGGSVAPMVVTISEDNVASHTAAEIAAHVDIGGDVWLDNGTQLHSITEDNATFLNVSIMDGNAIMQMIYISAHGDVYKENFNPASAAGIGDISKALDSIIAIQNELIGGGNV